MLGAIRISHVDRLIEAAIAPLVTVFRDNEALPDAAQVGAFRLAAGSEVEASGQDRGVSRPTTINTLALLRGHLDGLKLGEFVAMVRLGHYVFDRAKRPHIRGSCEVAAR